MSKKNNPKKRFFQIVKVFLVKRITVELTVNIDFKSNNEIKPIRIRIENK
jgi:hypothetical protein